MYNNTVDEVWEDIKGYEGLYRVSNKGRVYSYISSKLLKLNNTNKGYKSVTLCKDGKLKFFEVHRLVALQFIENPNDEYIVVNHKDENPKNNSVENLEWCTHKYNLHYSYYRKHGRYPNTTNQNEIKTPKKRKIIGKSIETGKTITLNSITSCIEHGFARACVKDCLNGKQHKHKGYTWEYAN